MPVRFRYATLSEYQRVAGFLNDHWAENHIYVRMFPLFDWTFGPRADSGDRRYNVMLAEDGEEMVGMLGGIPFNLNRFGACLPAVWIVNYVVRPDHRRGSTALQLLGTYRQDPYQAVVAFGINPATAAIYKVLRGRVLQAIPRHFLVLPDASARAAKLFSMAYPDWEAGRAESLSRAFQLRSEPDSAPEAGDTVPPAWDTRDWPAIASRTVGAARDSAYLRWRYASHPCFEYKFIAIPAGNGRTGLAVWRLETIRTAPPEGRREVERIGRLVEFLPASADNAAALYSAFISHLRAAGAMGADFYCYHGETRRLLSDLGFHPVGSHEDGALIPSRFQPLDAKGGGIMSAMFVPAELELCTEDDDCAWYWTKSDADQDRPN